MKMIQISEELFVEIARYFILSQEERKPIIIRELERKMESLARRKLYTKYKTDPDEAEREKARKEYLDKCGVPESFRW